MVAFLGLMGYLWIRRKSMSSYHSLDAGGELTRVLLSALIQPGGLSELSVPHILARIGVSFDSAHLEDILADEFEEVRVVDLLTLAGTNHVEVLFHGEFEIVLLFLAPSIWAWLLSLATS